MLNFHVKFLKTDRRTDGQTTVKQYAPDLSTEGHKKVIVHHSLRFLFVLSKSSARGVYFLASNFLKQYDHIIKRFNHSGDRLSLENREKRSKS